MDETVAQGFGIGKTTVQRYIRLTELIPPILQMVDEGRLPLPLRWNCLFEEGRAGKPADYDGERGRYPISFAGAAHEKLKPDGAAIWIPSLRL